MKAYKTIIALLGLGAMLLSACDNKEHELSTQNRGKAKPTVNVDMSDHTLKTFELEFTLSEDASYFGYAVYAVYPEEEITAPSGYDIISGSASGAISNDAGKADEPTASCFCVDTENYKIYAVAMTETGLLGEVVSIDINIPGALPKFTVKEGIYEVTPSEKHPDATNPKALDKHRFMIQMYDAVTYLLSTDYFGHFNSLEASPYLVGKPDFKRNQLVFDGSTYDEDEGFEDSNCFYYNLYYYWNDAKTEAAGYVGSGESLRGPARIQGDDETSELTEFLDGFGVEVYTNDGGWGPAYLFDFFMPGSTIEYIGE